MLVDKFLVCKSTPAAAAVRICLGLSVLTFGGCGDVLPPVPGPLFTIGLKVNDRPEEPAIVDTGGGYELMLRRGLGLEILDEVEVLGFHGPETVGFTRGFSYTVGDVSLSAQTALVGISVCDCNGVGYLFFRRAGKTLGVDFAQLRALLLDDPPKTDVLLAFGTPPETLPHFDSAFITVEVSTGHQTVTVNALLDTGTNGTIMRRGLLTGEARPFQADRLDVTISRPELGVVAANVLMFDTVGLPDLVLGTDVMRAWADRWYFTFTPRGGTVSVESRAAPTGAAPARF